MAKYYYDRYNTITTESWRDDAPWEPLGLSNYRHVFSGKPTSYTFDQKTNKYSNRGEWDNGAFVNAGVSYYHMSGDSGYRYDAYTSAQAWESVYVDAYVKYASKNSKNTIYSRGSLVQSNIQAEDSTYPTNGRHTDGYWYVRGVAVNTAPTTPGAFTQPSGTLEIGDSKVFTVGASTDAEGNLAKYVWEASINGGSYVQVGETTVPNFTYTIPTTTSLKMRVKAADTGGLESGYRESALYTVSKPVYYWAKYNTISHTLWTRGPWLPTGDNASTFNNAKSFIFDSLTNTVTLQGKWGVNEQLYPGSANYFLTGDVLVRQDSKYQTVNNGSVEHTGYIVDLRTNKSEVVHSRGSLVQSNIQAAEGTYPTNGRHSDGFWYVRGSRVNQSIAPPGKFTAPSTGKIFKPSEVANIAFEASNAPSIASYEVDYRYGTGTWTPLAYNNTLSRSLTITTDKSLKTLELRVRAKNTSNVYSDYVYSESFVIEHNNIPTVSLTSPGDNSTLYENDILNIAGTAHDENPDQTVTVYYQVNSEQRKVLATNLSQMQIPLSKQLKFTGGKLLDGETVVASNLSEGVAHMLRVWAVDSEGGESVVSTRSFYVVPNRAPLLSVDAVVLSGVVDADKFKISGTASDQDANANVTVTHRINAGNSIEIYNGPGGAWEFEVSLAQLVVGQNTIIIEVIDNYGAKTSKTIKLNKDEVKTPILQSVARYQITPPKGSAKGVLLFIERDVDLDLKAELSMTLTGEQEQYVTLVADNTAPMPNVDGIVEDTFYYEAIEPKNNIILKLSTSRPDVNINHKIHLISGAVE